MSLATTGNTSPELLDLMEHEKVIEQGLMTFVEVGAALLAIRDGKKYRAAGYSTWEDYCDRRWQMSRQRAWQLMRAAQIVELVAGPGETETTVSILPTAEGQVRPLAPLRDEPEKLQQAWNRAVELAEGDVPSEREVRQAVEEIRTSEPERIPQASDDFRNAEPRIPAKPDLGNGVSHPARYSPELLPVFSDILDGYPVVLDPFAGTGRIHALQADGFDTHGIELEAEWASMHPATICGDALAVMADMVTDGVTFDAICTSPAYGNRLADKHNASDPERRRSYTHDLGRQLTDGNSGAMQWGDEYRDLHADAWALAVSLLRDGGRFVLNIKDHVRGGELQLVSHWHTAELGRLGLTLNPELSRAVGTRTLDAGANADARKLPELVLVFDKFGGVR